MSLALARARTHVRAKVKKSDDCWTGWRGGWRKIQEDIGTKDRSDIIFLYALAFVLDGNGVIIFFVFWQGQPFFSMFIFIASVLVVGYSIVNSSYWFCVIHRNLQWFFVEIIFVRKVLTLRSHSFQNFFFIPIKICVVFNPLGGRFWDLRGRFYGSAWG